MRALKTVLFSLILVFLPVLSSFFIAPSFAAVLPFTTSISTETGGVVTEAELSQGTDSLNDKGEYTLTFDVKRGPRNTNTGEIKLLIALERDRCPEGNGQSKNQTIRYPIPWDGIACYSSWDSDDYHLITLNASNNYTQTVSTTVKQQPAVSCGSFQIDTWYMALNDAELFTVRNGQGVTDNANSGLKRFQAYQLSYQGKTYPNAVYAAPAAVNTTKRDLATCQPTPTPTPTPTSGVSPSPSPTSSPRVPVPPIQPETGIGILGASIIFGGGPLGYFLLRHRKHHKAIIHEEPQELTETAQDIVEGREEKKDTTTGTGGTGTTGQA